MWKASKNTLRRPGFDGDFCALSTEFVNDESLMVVVFWWFWCMSWAIQKFEQQNPLILHDFQSCSAQFNPSQCALEPCSSVTKLETVAKAGSSVWFWSDKSQNRNAECRMPSCDSCFAPVFLQGACLRACLVRQGGTASRLYKCTVIWTVFCLACMIPAKCYLCRRSVMFQNNRRTCSTSPLLSWLSSVLLPKCKIQDNVTLKLQLYSSQLYAGLSKSSWRACSWKDRHGGGRLIRPLFL